MLFSDSSRFVVDSANLVFISQKNVFNIQQIVSLYHNKRNGMQKD